MAQRSLEHRKAGIDRNKSKINFQTVSGYALKLRNHLLSLFGKNKVAAGKAMSWACLDMGERKAHISEVYKHISGLNGHYNGTKLRFGGVHSLGNGVLGAASESEITIYDSALKSNNYDQVIEVLSHEKTHNDQLGKAKTGLPKDVVDVCDANYVMPNESIDHYLENPVEKEARIVGQIVGAKILRDIFKSRSRQRAA